MLKRILRSPTNDVVPRDTVVTTTNIDTQFINVAKYSRNDIGKKLAPGYPHSFGTIIGKVGNLRNVFDLASTVNYPLDLLGKKRLTASDINRIPMQHKHNVNYWGIVAYFLLERIASDKPLMLAMKETNLEYIAVNITKTENWAGNGNVIIPNKALGKYLSIIRHISILIKEDKFTPEHKKELIIACKQDKDKSIFDELPVEVDSTYI